MFSLFSFLKTCSQYFLVRVLMFIYLAYFFSHDFKQPTTLLEGAFALAVSTFTTGVVYLLVTYLMDPTKK